MTEIHASGEFGGRVADHSTSLREWLGVGPFSLSMAPGFFCFFAHVGALRAISECVTLDKGTVVALSGCSAGALTAAFVAAGVPPDLMEEELLRLEARDICDPGPGLLSLLRGEAIQSALKDRLGKVGVDSFSDFNIPTGVTAFNPLRLRTETICSGDAVKAVVASASVPLLFPPVRVDGSLLVDGAFGDPSGVRGLPAVAPSGRILQISFGWWSTASPESFPPHLVESLPQGARGLDVLNLRLPDLPQVWGPLDLARGATVLRLAYEAVRGALDEPVRRQRSRNGCSALVIARHSNRKRPRNSPNSTDCEDAPPSSSIGVEAEDEDEDVPSSTRKRARRRSGGLTRRGRSARGPW